MLSQRFSECFRRKCSFYSDDNPRNISTHVSGPGPGKEWEESTLGPRNASSALQNSSSQSTKKSCDLCTTSPTECKDDGVCEADENCVMVCRRPDGRYSLLYVGSVFPSL
ncbi:hypothetical protein ElyMa_000842000 [Elysia marginata]|uniref:WAP domain-containing protein n=1 Tax=Elysia marginata TaxID=1093978 RepID=A0AAV4H3I3_9GAST|nr:hypothetical protein ElyMa_000842000 [Elysia marginata]